MKVFISGGTGAIGWHAVQGLVGAGHEVTALARSSEKADRLRAGGAQPVSVSLFDKPGLAEHLAGQEAVINLATAIPKTSEFMRPSAWVENSRIRTEGSATLVDAALAVGVPRYIQESVCMLYRDRGNEWIDEDWHTDHFPMAEANHAAEESANRFARAGGFGVILRFGWFYGPGATHSEEFMDLARRRRIAIAMGPPRSFLSSIHVEDGGAAVAAALGVPSGVHNVVDDEPLTKREYADARG